MKASDTQAASIQWGIELETRIPDTAGVSVGGYHNGLPVRVGMDQANGLPLTAPTFDGGHWRADRDGSIACDSGQTPCEFVSPILRGEGGVEHLMRFVEWLNAIGATVNGSCGCHITVGIESVIGTHGPEGGERVHPQARPHLPLARQQPLRPDGRGPPPEPLQPPAL